MALYTTESRDRVRDAIDFVELVSARTELRRAGQSRYEGLCPFHDERTPSFGIDPVQKLYYCFGCQAAGDVFTFVQETESLDFKGALELLADRCGIELEREAEDPREAERRRRRERLLELLARTSAYYERCLWESAEAARVRSYLLEERSLSEPMLREFKVGYAPSAWDRVLSGSLRSGFSEAELYEVGLIQRSREAGRVYDRFRARIMFPLTDMRGRVLGFGARLLDGAPSDAGGGSDAGGRGSAQTERRPKYLNTSDNAIYHKGRHLYGADLARQHAARAGRTILCEGYTDVIALHQAGLRGTVGLMGTALTADQVGELARMAPTVLMALDADSAGQEAMLRAAGLAAKRKLELRVVPLPAGADPAELVQREGAGAIEQAIERSVPFVRFQVQRVLDAGDDTSAEGRDRMLEALRPVFATIPASAVRMELTQAVADRLGLPQSLAERTLAARVPSRTPPSGARSEPAEPRARNGAGDPASLSARSVGARGEGTERTFLALCIADPDAGAKALAEIDPASLFASDAMRRAVQHLRGRLNDPGAGLPEDDPQLAALIAEIVVEAGREPPAPAMLESQRMQLELARIDREIARARGQEAGEVTALAHRRAEVKREFDRAYERALEQTG